MTEKESKHTGKPIIRISTDRKAVVVLCPYGHLVTTLPMKEWAGSWLEAEIGDPNYTVSCSGTITKSEVTP